MGLRPIPLGPVAAGLLALACVGCGPTPEERLPGTWGVTPLSSMAQVRAILDETPDVSGSQAAEAARALQKIRLKLSSDKTFRLAMADRVFFGTWTYEAKAGHVWLTIERAETPAPEPPAEPDADAADPASSAVELEATPDPGPDPRIGRQWLARFDVANDHLNFLQVDRDGLERLKESGGSLKGIILRKG